MKISWSPCAPNRGACSLTFNKQAGVASVPNVIYKNIEACGQCIEVSGPAGSTVIMVVDRCNNCADNMMVISKPAFDKIAGSSAYWTAIQARNHTWAVKSMAFKRDGQWVEMTRSNDNYFVAEKGVGKGPLALRITATDGQTVEHTFETWKDGETYQSPVQFK
jgi:expansin (peptidoglycan-binding protein)